MSERKEVSLGRKEGRKDGNQSQKERIVILRKESLKRKEQRKNR